MSRSYKKPIYKDKGNILYNRICRRRNKQLIRQGKEPLDNRSIVNDYDICDFKVDYVHCIPAFFFPNSTSNTPSEYFTKNKLKLKRK